jgi:hypothetical protein
MKFAVEQALALAGRTVKPLVLAAFSLVFRAAAFAVITTEAVEYKDGDPVLEGFAADDDANAKARPGLLPIHASDRAARRRQATRHDAGGGVHPTNPKERGRHPSTKKRSRWRQILRRCLRGESGPLVVVSDEEIVRRAFSARDP